MLLLASLTAMARVVFINDGIQWCFPDWFPFVCLGRIQGQDAYLILHRYETITEFVRRSNAFHDGEVAFEFRVISIRIGYSIVLY